ncbi:MAG: phosphatase PAP2 family protein [Sphaerochaetaceae bacterium]|nr:phosphatase PAP2 family protein [Sphaerochaetaceae bacterium]MDD4220516.1 phosphatase PAP2 family protein [Sphaerochaetaceae bacterium]MDY0372027.1 phosphatase PAP2 family protein [Sphaerochaetaceae bacterium]
MQLTIMEFFQKMSSPFLDKVFEIITMFGEETVFILAVAFFLWCASKKHGFVIFSSLFTSLIGMSALKAIIRAPRPFQVVPEIAGKRIATATGYSFPSGHTTGAASFYSALAVTYRKRWLSIISALLILLVAISRLYLGVHWPLDVFAGLALGITVTFVAYRWFDNLYDKPKNLHNFSLLVGSVSLILALLLVFLIELGIADPIGFSDPMKLFSLAAGGYLGFAWDQRNIQYSTEGTTLLKILRLALGLIILVAIQALKLVLGPHSAVAFFRYALTGVWATALYPFIGTKIRIGKTTHLFETSHT